MPMLSVEKRVRVPAKSASQRSIVSSRASNGTRFQRAHEPQITQSRPCDASNASRRPIGSVSSTSLAPRFLVQ
jgi:hypothetical protein